VKALLQLVRQCQDLLELVLGLVRHLLLVLVVQADKVQHLMADLVDKVRHQMLVVQVGKVRHQMEADLADKVQHLMVVQVDKVQLQMEADLADKVQIQMVVIQVDKVQHLTEADLAVLYLVLGHETKINYIIFF